MAESAAKGYTMVELMAVVAILALLAAILFPVMSGAKRRAKLGADVEGLRQLGVAAALYAETHGDWPLSVLEMRGTEVWNSPLWAGGTDPYREGFRNELLSWLASRRPSSEGHYARRIVPFKVSYVGIGDVFEGATSFQERARARGNAGWLLSFGDQDVGGLRDPGMVLGGPFTRLNYDGSVVHRASQTVQRTSAFLWLFADATPEDKKDDMDGER